MEKCANDKKYHIEAIVITPVNIEKTHSICKLKYVIPKEITIIIYNGSNYDNHFMIKGLAK